MFTRTFLTDLAERTIATYVEALTGLLIASWADVANLGVLSVAESAAVAAIPMALAVVKGAFAARRGDSNSAAMVKS